MSSGVWCAFDPGVSTGMAIAAEGALIRACLLEKTEAPVLVDTTQRIVEIPQWRGPRTPAPVKHLIGLACRAGQLGGAAAEYVTPSEWKGTEAKNDMHFRLGEILTPDERKVIESIACPRALRHNVLDAVCLLMWRLGRFRTSGSKKHGAR